MITRDFVTAGKAIFTVEVPATFTETHPECKPHYTFKVRVKPATLQYPATYFVSMLNGPDNYANYGYVGILEPATGELRLTAKSPYAAETYQVRILRRVLQRVWAGEQNHITEAGWNLHHEGKCGKCGRRLTTPESCTRGIGPECIKYFALANV